MLFTLFYLSNRIFFLEVSSSISNEYPTPMQKSCYMYVSVRNISYIRERKTKGLIMKQVPHHHRIMAPLFLSSDQSNGKPVHGAFDRDSATKKRSDRCGMCECKKKGGGDRIQVPVWDCVLRGPSSSSKARV